MDVEFPLRKIIMVQRFIGSQNSQYTKDSPWNSLQFGFICFWMKNFRKWIIEPKLSASRVRSIQKTTPSFVFVRFTQTKNEKVAEDVENTVKPRFSDFRSYETGETAKTGLPAVISSLNLHNHSLPLMPSICSSCPPVPAHSLDSLLRM